MNAGDSFSVDYQQARGKFRQAARSAGAASESLAHPERGPDGADLSTDIAWIGPRAAERVLVMISATHGVEGFCGSGAQVDYLARGEAAILAGGTAILMIHAINPYGFAWLRRVTHENVDLNRNWIDFDRPAPSNPGYDALSEAICPAEWSETTLGDTGAKLAQYAATWRHGHFQQAVSGGQYVHPSGIFYGGAAPTWSRKTQTAIFEHYLDQAGQVAIIDYHTGLGPWGYGERIITAAPGSAEFDRAARIYGAAITSPSGGTSTSADIKGDGLSVAPDLAPRASVVGMALEFGVQPLAQTLDAVRADAWLHAHGELGSEQGVAIKRQVRDAFFGDSDDWKGMIVGQSLLACRQALAGLAPR